MIVFDKKQLSKSMNQGSGDLKVIHQNRVLHNLKR